MRSIAPCIVGLTLAVNLGAGCGQPWRGVRSTWYLSKQTPIALRLIAHLHWQTNGARIAAGFKCKLIEATRARDIGYEACWSHCDYIAVFRHKSEIERIKSPIRSICSFFGLSYSLSPDLDMCLCHPFPQAD